MKKIILAIAAVLAFSAQAQTTGTVFTLTGDYVKIGVSNYGTIGSKGNTPPGIQYDNTGTGTFNASYDYLTPGSPFEGFTVKYTNSAGTLVSQTNNNTGAQAITGGILTNYSGVAYNGTTFDNRAVWTGNGTGYALEHDYRFNNSHKYIDITTTLTSSVSMTNLYFGRFIDPDARAAAGDSSATTNTLGYSPIGDKQVVFSEALASKYALGLYSAASNVGAGISSSWTTDPVNYYNGVNSGTGDYTIGLGFYVSSVAVGDIVTFQYAYIFGPSTLDAGTTAVTAGVGGGTAGVVPGCTTGCTMGTTTPTVVSTSTTTITTSNTDAVSTTLPVIVGSVAHHVATEKNDATQSIARATTTTTTTPMVNTVVTVDRTTTTWSDGTTTTSDASPVTTTSLWNSVTSNTVNETFTGRIDQRARMAAVNDIINRSFDINSTGEEGIKTDDGTIFYAKNGDMSSSLVNYTASTQTSSIGVEKQIDPEMSVGIQTSAATTNLTGTDSTTSQDKTHIGLFGSYKLENGVLITANLGLAQNKIKTTRTVGNVFNNSSTGETSDIWLSKRIYAPEDESGVRPFIGLTYVNMNTQGYKEAGSVQSARTVHEKNTDNNYFEIGLGVNKAIDDIRLSGEGSITSDALYSARLSAAYKLNKNSSIGLNVSQHDNKYNETTHSAQVNLNVNF